MYSKTDDDGNVETSTNRNSDCQFPNDPSLNRDARMPVRQTDVRRVANEAKALIPLPLCSTRAPTIAAAQEALVEALPSDGRRSDNELWNTPDGTIEDIPIRYIHASNHTRDPDKPRKDNQI